MVIGLPTSSWRRTAPKRTPALLTSRVWTSSKYELPETSWPEILTGNTALARSTRRLSLAEGSCPARALFEEIKLPLPLSEGSGLQGSNQRGENLLPTEGIFHHSRDLYHSTKVLETSFVGGTAGLRRRPHRLRAR